MNKEKNPIMIKAGKKAYKTRLKNKAKLAEKLSEAGRKAAFTRKVNLVALPVSFGKIATINKSDLPSKIFALISKHGETINKEKNIFDLQEGELLESLSIHNIVVDCGHTGDEIDCTLMAIYNKTKDCDFLKIV